MSISAYIPASPPLLGVDGGSEATDTCLLSPVHATECHYCGFSPPDELSPPRRCPKCGGAAWDRFVRPGSLLRHVRSNLPAGADVALGFIRRSSGRRRSRSPGRQRAVGGGSGLSPMSGTGLRRARAWI